jgi:hypothetical protein
MGIIYPGAITHTCRSMSRLSTERRRSTKWNRLCLSMANRSPAMPTPTTQKAANFLQTRLAKGPPLAAEKRAQATEPGSVRNQSGAPRNILALLRLKRADRSVVTSDGIGNCLMLPDGGQSAKRLGKSRISTHPHKEICLELSENRHFYPHVGSIRVGLYQSTLIQREEGLFVCRMLN